MVFQEQAARELQGNEVGIRGRKAVFTNGEELSLKECIVKLAELGFAPTLNDIKEIVTDYVNINEIEKAQQIFNFIGLKGCPDKDWLSGFMRRENLSLKTATKLSKPHQNITINPFLINDWFHILEETVKDLVLEDRPDLIWNADESSVPHDPKKCKVISLRGQPTYQIVAGSDRDNSTILAAVSGNGETLPPLIIFQGKEVQTTWRPSAKPTHKYYPWIYANDSGWMKSDIFFKWFLQWEVKIRSFTSEGDLENRIIIYDGHLSYVGFPTLKQARENKVVILKLMPHTTDLLQPLKVSVFKTLKEKWGQILYGRLRKTRKTLTKSEFSTILSSDEVCERSFIKVSIQNGFRN